MIKTLNKLNSDDYKFDKKTKIGIYIFIFLIGAIIGFIYEEIFCLLFDHELVKRGFLYGPYLPVYGFGAVLMIMLLKRFKKNPLIVFLLAMLLTGILEYFTGYLLFQIYHKTWWDYTGLFLNIDGYVCLRSVLTFGIGGLLLIYIVDPLVCKLAAKAKNYQFAILSFAIVCVFFVDFIFTMIFRNSL